MSGWDDEYIEGGIPSSFRHDPSGAVIWALEVWPRLTGTRRPRRALDVGCGTARNTAYLARLGVPTTGIDASAEAIERARVRIAEDRNAAAVQHDLRDGLPARDGEIDLLLDVFVYKHVVEPAERAAYRGEMIRVLAPGGVVLLSLSEPSDGYYGACPPGRLDGTIVDPATGVGSVLFTLAQLTDEVCDTLELAMAWRKRAPGEMHGASYERHTLVTLWRAR